MNAVVRAIAIACGVTALQAGATAPIKTWDAPTPRLVHPALEGGTVDLQSLHGRVVLVNFWATWCEPCRAEMPAIERLKARLHDRPFEVLAVNYGESRERVAEFVRKEGVGLRVLLDRDQESARTWQAKGLPMTFLVDATGRVRYWTFGERNWDEGEGLALVEKLVSEAPGARH